MMVLAAESCKSHVMLGVLISQFMMLFSTVCIADVFMSPAAFFMT